MHERIRELQLYIMHIKKNGIKTSDYNVLIFVLYGIFFDIVNNMYRPFSVKFTERLGGNDFHFSLLNSLPGLVAVFVVLPGSLFLARVKNKKRATIIFFALARAFLLTFAVIPFLPPGVRPMVFVVLLGFMNFPDAISQTALQSYLGQIFNPYTRAKSIALRIKAGNIAVLLVTFVTGMVINFVADTNEQKIFAYQVFFVLAFIFGIFEVIAFAKFKENNNSLPQNDVSFDFKKSVSVMLKDKKFISFFGSTLLFYFTWHMGWPLGNIIFIKQLRADELWVAVNTITAVIAIIFSSTYWGRKVVKNGNSNVLAICSAGIGVTIFITAISPNLLVFIINTAFVNFFLAGINITLLNGLLESTPSENRVFYIGVYNTFINVSLAIAPMVSLVIMQNTSYVFIGLLVCMLRILSGVVIYVLGKKKSQ